MFVCDRYLDHLHDAADVDEEAIDGPWKSCLACYKAHVDGPWKSCLACYKAHVDGPWKSCLAYYKANVRALRV